MPLALAVVLAMSPWVAAAEAAPADPELDVLATSLAAGQRATVDAACGGLANLPRYRIDARLDPEHATVVATEELALPLSEAATELFFRIPANSSFLDRGLGAPVSITVSRGGNPAPAELASAGVIRVALVPEAAAGELLVLRFEITARVPEQSSRARAPDMQMMQQAMAFLQGAMARDRLTDFGAFGHDGDVFHLAGFLPELVRRDGPGFDLSPEPGIGEPRWGRLANYTVSLVTPSGWTSAGTGTVVGDTVERDGSRRVTRVAAAVRGVALVAAAGFTEQKQNAGPVRVRIVSSPENAKQAKKLLDTAARAVSFFAAKLGPYPWADLEVAEAPLTDGLEALSYPGLVSASGLLIDPNTARALAGLTPRPEATTDSILELAVAHHVAHQWFGGQVGSDSREHPALMEPVAFWAGLTYVEQRRGAKAMRDLLDSQVRNGYRVYRMLGGDDRAVDRPVTDYRGRAEMQALLDGKGVLFHARLRDLVGDQVLWQAMRKRVAAERFHDVETDGLLPALAAAAPGKAARALQLYDRWFHQQHGDEDVGGAMDLNEVLKAAGIQMPPGGAGLMPMMPVAPPANPQPTPKAQPNSQPQPQPKTHP